MWDYGVKYQPDEIWRIIDQYKELPAGEQTRLARLAQSGDTAARDRLILCNLRLVVNKVKPWLTPTNGEDVIQEGIAGLCEAIKRYKPDSGYAFCTYAVPWIQWSVRMWKFAQNKVYVSRHVHDEAIKVRRWLYRNDVSDPQQIAEQVKLSIDHVEHAMRFNQLSYGSLDRKVNPKPNSEPLGNFIPDTSNDEYELIENEIDRQSVIQRLLSTLTENESLIIQLVYGLSGAQPMPISEIARRRGTTRQAVDQIYQRAMKKLRAAGVEEARAS